jgi:hypothetical protein
MLINAAFWGFLLKKRLKNGSKDNLQRKLVEPKAFSRGDFLFLLHGWQKKNIAQSR